jgi:hypothetical protein
VKGGTEMDLCWWQEVGKILDPDLAAGHDGAPAMDEHHWERG